MFVGGSGASVKYLEAVISRRTVWVSQAFRLAHPLEWLLILEVLSRRDIDHNRTFLESAGAWAAARAHAERKKRPADVIALVGPEEVRSTLKHCFSPAGLVVFLARSDPNKGSIGLLNM